MPPSVNAAPKRAHLPERLSDLVTGPIRLAALETWITAPAQSEDGWAEIKPFLLVRLMTTTGVGGILDMLEIAGLAQGEGVAVSPHCWNSMTVAAAAMLHVCAAIPNADMAEIYPEYIAHGVQYAALGFRLDGAQATLSAKPGLGVEINAAGLSACSEHFHASDLAVAVPT